MWLEEKFRVNDFKRNIWKILFVCLLTWEEPEKMDMFTFYNERAEGNGDNKYRALPLQ